MRLKAEKTLFDVFAWMLADARLLPFKPCKGQLKFFTPTL
jgi:hypothetical protein